jgi:signal transduction histidine kinase
MPEQLGGVRVRLTLIAVAVTVLVSTVVGAWLVTSVERSLSSDLRRNELDSIAEVRAALASGVPPADVDLRGIASQASAGGLTVQLIEGGRVLATTGPADPVLGGSPVARTEAAASAAGTSGTTRQVDLPEGRYSLTSEALPTARGELAVLAASPLEPIRQSVLAVRNNLLIALPILVGVVGLLTWVLAGRALRPVESIRREVEEISGTTLSRRVPVPTSADEVARLAATMNAMLDRLEDSASRQQRFVADASHELRSPVAAIRTELEVAQRTAAPEDWPAIAAQLLVEEARLERLIEDLLVLAALDEPEHAGRLETIALADVVTATPREPAEDRPGIVVDLATDVAVRGIPIQLERVVTNLVDNAVRHADRAVRVSLTSDGGTAVLEVDDDGPGIPVEDRTRVFDRFTRLDAHRSRGDGAGGSGLGLSLVRGIVAVHHGSVTIEDSPLGGTRVRVRLPLAARPLTSVPLSS